MCDANDPAGLNAWPSGPLLAGPMVGEVGPTDVFIWAQARGTSPLTIEVTRATGGPAIEVQATPALADGYCVTFHVTGLTPATGYGYAFASVAHGARPDAGRFRTAPASAARKARIVVGSCFHDYGQPGEDPRRAAARDAIFRSIAAQRPDVFVLAGDTCYYESADLVDPAHMLCAHLRNRNVAGIREVLPFVSTIATWDDHDYGPDNADQRWPYKDTRSLPVFKRMWAQRSWGEQGRGVYSSVRCGPAEIFLLDGRYFRDKSDPGRSVLGSQQLAWLQRKLLASDAPVKIIVSTTVVLPEFIGTLVRDQWEGWQVDGKADRDDVLLPFIERNDIKGVIFVSGDLHVGLLCRRPATVLPGGAIGPTYWELVSSPLANQPWNRDGAVVLDSTPTYDRCVLLELDRANYGVIDIDLDRVGAEVQLVLQQHDPARSAVVSAWLQPVPLASLRRREHRPRVAAVAWPNDKAYFFRGGRYTRYSLAAAGDVQHADPGYPRAIGDGWKELPADYGNGIDAGFAHLGTAYLFKGNGYVRYRVDPALQRNGPSDWFADLGYPKYIKLAWRRFWGTDLDAVVPWTNGYFYVFRGTQYLRCKLGSAEADGGPRPILNYWPGLAEAFPRGIDAGIVWNPQTAFFFKGEQYVRYNIGPAGRGVDGGVKLLAAGFPDLAAM